MPTFKPSPALSPSSDDRIAWHADIYQHHDNKEDYAYEVPRPKKWMGFVQGSSIEGDAWLPDPALTFEETITADLEEAEEIAEEVAELDFQDEAWGGQERDVWVLSPTGRKYHFCVRVEFSPSFSASQYRECPECAGTGLKDAKGVAEENIQIKCWRCHGQKEIA